MEFDHVPNLVLIAVDHFSPPSTGSELSSILILNSATISGATNMNNPNSPKQRLCVHSLSPR